MGPVNSRDQYAIVKDIIAEAGASGADVRECGSIHSSAEFQTGYFFRPILVLDPDQRLKIVTEEQFGPVVAIIPFDSEEDAVRWAASMPASIAGPPAVRGN
jgi:acyl-CoA reductase-like NAD-dependent aldehyde dehydrogenase